MANMSYCQFQNTSNDFQDCLDKIDQIDSLEELSDEERGAAIILYDMCQSYIDCYEALES